MRNRYWIVLLVAIVFTATVLLYRQNSVLQDTRAESAKYQLAVEALGGHSVQLLAKNNQLEEENFELQPNHEHFPARLMTSCDNIMAYDESGSPPLEEEEASEMYSRAITVLLYNLEPTESGKAVEQFDDYPGMKIAEAVYIQNRLREEGYYDLADALEGPLTECFTLGTEIGAIDMWEMRDVHNARLKAPY